jgi:VWFA-related protein
MPHRFAWTALLVGAAGLALAQAPPEYRSSITIVALPVFATDGQGRSVGGLQAEEFEVTDDGRPVTIVGFREIDANEPLPPGGRAVSPAARRQFLILFDLSFTSVDGLVRAREAALRFVTRELAEQDLAAVATFSPSHGVRVLVSFTDDRYQLRRAVASLGVLEVDRLADPLGLTYDLTEVGSAFADVPSEQGTGPLADAIRAVQVRFQRSEETAYRARVVGFIDGLGELGRSLDGLSGRKQVILLSAGFSDTTLVGEEGAQSVRDSAAIASGRLWEVQSENRFGDSQVRHVLAEALRGFAEADAVVHAVDLSGLSARGDARQQTLEPARRSGLHSLSDIANLSGGHLFKDTNDPGLALSEILELSRRYYLIAFEPAAARGPGHFHKLKVKLRRKGVRLSHRAGYRERPEYLERSPLARQFEAAELVVKGQAAGELAVKAIALPYRDASGRLSLPTVIEIDGGTLVGGRARPRVGLEVFGYAIDGADRVRDFVSVAASLDTQKLGERLRGRGVQCHAAFALGPGRYQLRFLVRDVESGRSGIQWLEVTVPSFDEGGVMLFPPLFMDDPAQWVVVHAPSRGEAGAPSPFRLAEAPFAPRARPSVENGRATSVCLLAFDGAAQRDPGASFELRPQMLAADGSPVAVGGFRVERSLAEGGGFRRFVLGFTPRDLAPGDYTLRVRLRDPASGRLSEAYQALSVE